MQYKQLGSSGLSVSEICLGTMTWGIQNTQQDADEQMAIALDAGINFVDTAEMYPVPPNAKTYGHTELIIGDWLSRNAQMREKIVLATKIAGNGLGYIRDGGDITGPAIESAINASLERLQTTYIDVYQLHWPNRTSPHFGKHWPGMVDCESADVGKEVDGMRDIVIALGNAIKAGKIRHWGLSDDTPWGIATYLRLCDELGVPRPVSIQNEFSLLHAKDWPYLIEMCHFENVAYLPWSPLATGLLSGKYLNNQRPEGARWSLAQRLGLFRDTEHAHSAVAEYVEVAEAANLSSAQMALAWCKQVPGVTSTIIGATKTSQLQENIAAFELKLDSSVLAHIDTVLHKYPLPY